MAPIDFPLTLMDIIDPQPLHEQRLPRAVGYINIDIGKENN